MRLTLVSAELTEKLLVQVFFTLLPASLSWDLSLRLVKVVVINIIKKSKHSGEKEEDLISN